MMLPSYILGLIKSWCVDDVWI